MEQKRTLLYLKSLSPQEQFFMSRSPDKFKPENLFSNRAIKLRRTCLNEQGVLKTCYMFNSDFDNRTKNKQQLYPYKCTNCKWWHCSSKNILADIEDKQEGVLDGK